MIQSPVKVGRVYYSSTNNKMPMHDVKVHRLCIDNDGVQVFYHFYRGDRRETFWQPEWEFLDEYTVPKLPTPIKFKENAERVK